MSGEFNDIRIDGSASGIVATVPRCGHFVIVESPARVGRLLELLNDLALRHATCAPKGAVQRTEFGFPVMS